MFSSLFILKLLLAVMTSSDDGEWKTQWGVHPDLPIAEYMCVYTYSNPMKIIDFVFDIYFGLSCTDFLIKYV